MVSDTILVESGQQFLSNVFTFMCAYVGVKTLTTTAYHLQTNALIERYIQMLVSQLRHYADDHQSG